VTADYRTAAGYSARRRADPRIAAAIAHGLDGAASVVNVGAGAGSYEPAGARVVAVEPEPTMLRQRAPGSAPVLRARAEALPLASGSVDAALAVLTIHHWLDWRAGLRELARVAPRRIVLFTWDPASDGFWLVRDYLPDMLAADRRRFPSLADLGAVLGRGTRVIRVPIPHDCSDGFMAAYWRRPAAYLDRDVRGAISSCAGAGAEILEPLRSLQSDLDSGAWERRNRELLARDDLDAGYCLVTWSPHDL
jgi:SAM-dependent methyltransferase